MSRSEGDSILLIVGSVFGAAHGVADDISERLESTGYNVEVNEEPTVEALQSADLDLLIVVTSTTGAGELPAELVPLYNTLRDTPPPIAGLKYAVIVLGDSSYGETFCGGGLALDEALADIGALRLADPLQIDAMETDEPETAALAFIEEQLKL